MRTARFNKELYISTEICAAVDAFKRICDFEYSEDEKYIIIKIEKTSMSEDEAEKKILEFQNYVLGLHKT